MNIRAASMGRHCQSGGKMKQPDDKKTMELPQVSGQPVKRGRGRPPTGQAKTGAQREKERAERLRAAGIGFLTVHLPFDVLAGLDAFKNGKDDSKSSIIERILRQTILRKR